MENNVQDNELFAEATVSAAIATTLAYGTRAAKSGQVPSVLTTFVTNAIGCAVYNEGIRKRRRPKTLLHKIGRGAGYGFLSAVFVKAWKIDTSVGFLAASATASVVGNTLSPYTTPMVDYIAEKTSVQ